MSGRTETVRKARRTVNTTGQAGRPVLHSLMFRTQAQGDDRKRVQLAAGLEVLILLKAAQRIARILIPHARGFAVQIAFLGQGFLNLLVAVGSGRGLTGAPFRGCRARWSLVYGGTHGVRRGFTMHALLRYWLRLWLWRSGRRQAGRTGQPGGHYRNDVSSSQCFSSYGWFGREPAKNSGVHSVRLVCRRTRKATASPGLSVFWMRMTSSVPFTGFRL